MRGMQSRKAEQNQANRLNTRLRLAEPIELATGSLGSMDNKALNRSVLAARVGQSSNGRVLPLYPTPFSQLQYFLTPRLTQALSRSIND